jgi:xanthine dehydrogenase accessory factor
VGDIESALALAMESKRSERWIPPVIKTDALRQKGIRRLLRHINRHKKYLEKQGQPPGWPPQLVPKSRCGRVDGCPPLYKLMVGIKSAGEMATAVACRLYAARIYRIFMLETDSPLAVRRAVAFSEAVRKKTKTVEGILAVKVHGWREIHTAWCNKRVAVAVDPDWTLIAKMRPHVVIDGILAKNNLGTVITEAPLVIGLGPGFAAGFDVHAVIETNRGHNLGRVIVDGRAESDTGIPGSIGGYARRRVFRAPVGGVFQTDCRLGDRVVEDQVIGRIGADAVRAAIAGMIRGILPSGTLVGNGCKLGDIDPRRDAGYLGSISDKGRAIGGGVLEAVLNRFNVDVTEPH